MFHKNFKAFRKDRGFSQEQMAVRLNVVRQSISKWENDKAYPEMTRLLFMSEYFGVSLDYLMCGKESDESVQDTAASYKAKSMLMIWNSFVSNLSDTQRKLVMVLYVLLICVCIAIVITFIYGVGYVFGQNIGHLQN